MLVNSSSVSWPFEILLLKILLFTLYPTFKLVYLVFWRCLFSKEREKGFGLAWVDRWTGFGGVVGKENHDQNIMYEVFFCYIKKNLQLFLFHTVSSVNSESYYLSNVLNILTTVRATLNPFSLVQFVFLWNIDFSLCLLEHICISRYIMIYHRQAMFLESIKYFFPVILYKTFRKQTV